MALGVFSRLHRCAKRATNRVACVGFREVNAFRRQPVDIGGFDHRIARTAHRVIAHLIGVDDQDVGLLAHPRNLEVMGPHRIVRARAA